MIKSTQTIAGYVKNMNKPRKRVDKITVINRPSVMFIIRLNGAERP
jgi:hypothetical protein